MRTNSKQLNNNTAILMKRKGIGFRCPFFLPFTLLTNHVQYLYPHLLSALIIFISLQMSDVLGLWYLMH